MERTLVNHESDPQSSSATYMADILAEADAICRRALRENVDQPDLLYLRGMIAERAGFFDLAVACFKRAAALDSTIADYWIASGRVLDLKNYGALAIHAYLNAMRLCPARADVFRGLSHVLRRQGRLPEALVANQEAVRRSSDDAQLFIEAGQLFVELRRPYDALAQYQMALMIDPLSAAQAPKLILERANLGSLTVNWPWRRVAFRPD
jgi:tetratricopeptide (TPR) repeat protein